LTQANLNGLQTNGSGVHERTPVPPRTRARSLLPSSWIKRTIELTLTYGGSVAGTLLDFCGAGPLMAVSLTSSESTQRVVSWDVVRFVDLRE
jgi:hypothetical protein